MTRQQRLEKFTEKTKEHARKLNIALSNAKTDEQRERIITIYLAEFGSFVLSDELLY